MRNKYMRRGVLLLLAGIALIGLGYYLMETELMKYGWAMIIGYIAFGAGFMWILYSLMRKIERRSLLNDRAEEAEKTENELEGKQSEV